MACIVERNREGVIGVAIIILKTKKRGFEVVMKCILVFLLIFSILWIRKGKACHGHVLLSRQKYSPNSQ